MSIPVNVHVFVCVVEVCGCMYLHVYIMTEDDERAQLKVAAERGAGKQRHKLNEDARPAYNHPHPFHNHRAHQNVYDNPMRLRRNGHGSASPLSLCGESVSATSDGGSMADVSSMATSPFASINIRRKLSDAHTPLEGAGGIGGGGGGTSVRSLAKAKAGKMGRGISPELRAFQQLAGSGKKKHASLPVTYSMSHFLSRILTLYRSRVPSPSPFHTPTSSVACF